MTLGWRAASSAIAEEPKPPKVQQPKARLIASARVVMAPARIDFTLLVKDPDKLIRCPSQVSWAWGVQREAGFSTVGESNSISDCDPFKPLADVPTSWTERRTLKLLYRGLWTVAACMRGMEALTKCDMTTVEVR